MMRFLAIAFLGSLSIASTANELDPIQGQFIISNPNPDVQVIIGTDNAKDTFVCSPVCVGVMKIVPKGHNVFAIVKPYNASADSTPLCLVKIVKTGERTLQFEALSGRYPVNHDDPKGLGECGVLAGSADKLMTAEEVARMNRPTLRERIQIIQDAILSNVVE